MAFSKAHLYPGVLMSISECGKILAHPERLAMIKFLKRNGPCIVTKILDQSPLSQPTISQHLKILRAYDIVSYEEVGPYIYYQLNDQVLKFYLESVMGFIGECLE